MTFMNSVRECVHHCLHKGTRVYCTSALSIRTPATLKGIIDSKLRQRLFHNQKHFYMRNKKLHSLWNMVSARRKDQQSDGILKPNKIHSKLEVHDDAGRVLEEARAQLGHPDWLNMFKNCFFGVCSNSDTVHLTNLLFSFVQHCCQDTDLETECLIVLLLASVSEKLSFFKNHPPGSSSLDTYDNFWPDTNSGHMSLANCLMMMRVCTLLLATEGDETRIYNGERCENLSDEKERDTAKPCGKFNKVRILTSDLCIAAIFNEAAIMGNYQILHHSFEALRSIIQGVFDKNQTRVTNYFQEGTGGFGANGADPLHLNNPESDNDRNLVDNFNSKISISTVQNGNEKHMDSTQDTGEDDPHGVLHLFVCKGLLGSTIHTWGTTDELGLMCKGCVAMSEHGENVQDAAFDFGHGLSLVKKTQMSDGLETNDAEQLLTEAISHLHEFPDCANKRLLTSLSRAYILGQ